MTKKLFCFDIVGLSPEFLDFLCTLPNFAKLKARGEIAEMEPSFPCLTLPGQATLSTGEDPSQHGIVANGIYYRDRKEISFWDQYSSLVEASPIWERVKDIDKNIKTAVLFWQNSLYGNADIIVTPKPMHTDEGLIQWCYSKPVGFYEHLCQNLKQPFNLMDYWGPLASSKSSSWIMDASILTLQEEAPDLMMIYLPHLDYSCQKFGPDLNCPEVKNDLIEMDKLMGRFIEALEDQDFMNQSSIAVFSEYSLSKVTESVDINRFFRKEGFLKIRTIEGREYIDFEMSRAFAMVDHQIAHIYITDKKDIESVQRSLEQLKGIYKILDHEGKTKHGIDHPRTGELIAVSDRDRWFAYYWWDDPDKAPDFADHIDIHRKPGYDPLELFMDPKNFKVSQTTRLIKGSHGAFPSGREGMASFMLSGAAVNNIELPDKIKMRDAYSYLNRALLE